MRVRDPLGQYNFNLPLGWAYSIQRSHLITLQFVRPDRAKERLLVRAIYSLAPNEPDDTWYKKAAERVVEDPRHVPQRLRIGSRPALCLTVDDKNIANKQIASLLMRGKNIDVGAQHIYPEALTPGKPTSVLTELARSLTIPLDAATPRSADQSEVYDLLDTAKAAAEKSTPDLEQVRAKATRALTLARDTYLASLVRAAPLPEVPAVLAVIDALIFMAVLDASPLHLRDAELLVNRARNTMAGLPMAGFPPLPPGRRDQILETLSGHEQAIASVQQALEEAVPGFEPDG